MKDFLIPIGVIAVIAAIAVLVNWLEPTTYTGEYRVTMQIEDATKLESTINDALENVKMRGMVPISLDVKKLASGKFTVSAGGSPTNVVESL